MHLERLELSLLEPQFSADPYPTLARIRAESPAYPVMFHGLPAYLVSRYQDVAAALSDLRLSVDKKYALDKVQNVFWVMAPDSVGLGDSMGFLDPPDHDRQRSLAAKTFTRQRMESMRESVQQMVDECIDRVLPLGSADILEDIAGEISTRMVMRLLGVPESDQDEFGRHAVQANSTDPEQFPQIIASLTWIQGYIAELVAAKRHALGDDLLSELVLAREDGDQLNEQELRSMAALLLVAGNENVANAIAIGILALLSHPDQLELLRADPSLIAAATEEILRYDSSVPLVAPRYTKEPVTIGGVTIPAGEPVILSTAGARRDPDRFADPDRFDLRRPDNVQHFAFGHGPRYCIAAHLGRIEIQTAVGTIIRRLPDLSLAVKPEELTWRISALSRGPNQLPVTFSPVPAGAAVPALAG